MHSMSNKSSYQKLSLLKSERTTFNLSNEAYELLEKLSKSYEITQKETLSLIMDDDELILITVEKIKSGTDEIAEDKSAKTKVISKGALEKLSNLAQREQISRDLLLEITLRELSDQLKKREENHKKALKIIKDSIKQDNATGKKLRDLLDKDDPILMRWDIIEIYKSDLETAIFNELKRGTPIDPNDPSQNI